MVWGETVRVADINWFMGRYTHLSTYLGRGYNYFMVKRKLEGWKFTVYAPTNLLMILGLLCWNIPNFSEAEAEEVSWRYYLTTVLQLPVEI